MIEITPSINYEGKLLEIQKLLMSKQHPTHLGKIESHEIAGCLRDNIFYDEHSRSYRSFYPGDGDFFYILCCQTKII